MNGNILVRQRHDFGNKNSEATRVKRKLGDSLRSRTDVAMKNEVLCKFLLHNVCVVHQSHVELGIEPVFWQNKPEDEPVQEPDVLPLVRPG